MLDHLQPLIHTAVSRKYENGDTILYQGEAPRSACILSKGIVRVFSISAQGDEQIVTYHIAGEFFPTPWIFGKASSTLFFYEAVGFCEVAFMPRKELIDFLLVKPERMHALLDYFTTSYAAFMIRVNALEQPRARDKLAYTLYYLCQKYGDNQSKKLEIPLTLTHQNLANLVGLTRETATSEMNKLKKLSILSYKSQRYSINKEKLLELMGEESLRDLSIKQET